MGKEAGREKAVRAREKLHAVSYKLNSRRGMK
jgi:hypothetical protein